MPAPLKNLSKKDDNMRKVVTPDGSRVMVSPHAPPGHPDYGSEELKNDRVWHRKIESFQDTIHKILADNNLWEKIGVRGGMSEAYRNIRKNDPEMPQLIKCVKLGIMGHLPSYGTESFKIEVPQEWWGWPFPGPIRRGHTIDNADWIINEEMKAIWAFAVVNTNDNPLDPRSKEFKDMLKLTDIERARYVMKTRVKLSRGNARTKIIIPAGCALRFTLFDDPELPREHPQLSVVRYDHTDPLHNPELRADSVYVDMHAYAGDPPSTIDKTRVMTDVE